MGGTGKKGKGMGEKSHVSLEGIHEDNEPASKWAAKASVFTNLFSEIDYTYQLYCALHPDDEATTKDELTLLTLESHLLNQQYNDLGFLVGTRLIILVEAQSTWSENIVIRVLLYVVQTWYKYIKRMKFDIYDEEKLRLPKPELYVIYTGENHGSKANEITLKENFFGGEDIDVDCRIKVLYDGEKGDIINQYVRFCHVFNKQVRMHGRTRQAVEETIRICQAEDVLKEYLEKQRGEVIDMMLALFDQETLMKNHEASIERKGRREGRKEGRREGRREMADLMAFLVKNGRMDDIARASADEGHIDMLLREFKEQAMRDEALCRNGTR